MHHSVIGINFVIHLLSLSRNQSSHSSHFTRAMPAHLFHRYLFHFHLSPSIGHVSTLFHSMLKTNLYYKILSTTDCWYHIHEPAFLLAIFAVLLVCDIVAP